MSIENQKRTVHFEETQRLPSIWYFVTAGLNAIVLGYFVFGNYVLKHDWFYNSISRETRVFVIASITILTIGVFFSHLKIIVRDSGLNIYYWPFVNREIKFDEILEYEVIRYKPMIDFSVWGMKGFEGQDVTYNVSGKQGIRLHLKNGNTMVVGSQMVDNLVYALYTETGKKDGADIVQFSDAVTI